MRNQLTFLIFLGLFLFSIPSSAQDFKSAIGLRLGYPNSVTYKHFINKSGAIELYAGTRGFNRLATNSYKWYSASVAYQIHAPIEGVDGLAYYYGAGASAYFWNFSFVTESAKVTMGLQGYGGLSYTVDGTPLNLSFDWVPTFFINGFSGGFRVGYGNLAVRYVLN